MRLFGLKLIDDATVFFFSLSPAVTPLFFSSSQPPLDLNIISSLSAPSLPARNRKKTPTCRLQHHGPPLRRPGQALRDPGAGKR